LKHRRYNAQASKTSKLIRTLKNSNKDTTKKINTRDLRDELLIYFGTGAVKCEVISDTMCVQNLCSDNNVILEAIYETDNPFSSVKFDGIVGLSFTHLSVTPESNFIDMLLKQNKIERNLFSFYFNKNDTSKSEIAFGGINRDKILGSTEDIQYFKVISKDYWEIKIDNIYYGNAKFNLCEKFHCTAIVDTGTSMIAGPRGKLPSDHRLHSIGHSNGKPWT
jgi:cathepsin D